jgi:hypothetical protein
MEKAPNTPESLILTSQSANKLKQQNGITNIDKSLPAFVDFFETHSEVVFEAQDVFDSVGLLNSENRPALASTVYQNSANLQNPIAEHFRKNFETLGVKIIRKGENTFYIYRLYQELEALEAIKQLRSKVQVDTNQPIEIVREIIDRISNHLERNPDAIFSWKTFREHQGVVVNSDRIREAIKILVETKIIEETGNKIDYVIAYKKCT